MRFKALLVPIIVLAVVSPARAEPIDRTPPFDAGEVCYLTAAGSRCANESSLDPAAPLAAQAREGKLAVGVLWWRPDALTVTRSAAITRFTPGAAGVLRVSGRGLIIGREFCLGIGWVADGVNYLVERCSPGPEIGAASVSTPVVAGRQYDARFSVRWNGDFLPGGAKINHIDLTFTV